MTRVLTALLALVSLPAVAATHPSVLFGPEDLPGIRARLAGPEKPFADSLRAGVEAAFDGSGFPSTPTLGYRYFDPIAVADSTLVFAFAAAVWGDQPDEPIAAKAKTLGRNYLVGVCGYSDWEFAAQQGFPGPDVNLGHFLFDVALAYDWLYPQLTPAERQTCQARMAIEGEKMHRGARLPATSSSPWWIEQYLQNHHWVNNAGLGMAALAFRGELSAGTDAWLSTATVALDKVRAGLDLVPGGAWHEGNGYLNYGLDSLVPFSVAKTRAVGGVDFADNRLVRDYPMLRMFAMPPAQAHRREYPVWGDFSGFEDHNVILTMRYVARATRDPLAAWATERYHDGRAQGVAQYSKWPPAQRGVLLSLLVADDTVAPAPPGSVGAWSLDYLATDLGLLLGRSSWEDGGTLLAFKSGVFGGRGNFERMKVNGAPGGRLNVSHNHAHDMSVYLFADSEWQTSNVPGYFIGRNNGSPQANKTRYSNSLLVDGNGQLGEGVRPEDFSRIPWFFERTSSITEVGSTNHYSFSRASGAKLYPPSSGLTRFERSVLFADRAFPIVRDVVRASGKHRFEVTYHAMDSVAQDGPWLKLAGKNDRVLGVRVVSPEAFSLSTESQSTTHLNKFDPDGQMTAAFVRPNTPSDSVNFLTALVPARGSAWGSRPQVAAIDPQVPDRGLTLTGLDGNQQLDVVFSDEPGQTSSAAGVSVTGLAGVKKSQGSQISRVMLASGSKLVIDQTPWIEVLSNTPASFEVEVSADALEVSGDGVPARFYAPGVAAVRFNGQSLPFERSGDFVTLNPPPVAAAPSLAAGSGSLARGVRQCAPGDAEDADCIPEGVGCASTSGSPWLFGLAALLIPLALRRRVKLAPARR